MTTPLFLDAALANRHADNSKGTAFERLYSSYGFDEAQITRLEGVAFGIYRDDESRLFRWTAFEEAVGVDVATRLLEGGSVLREREMGYFRHHLEHDYLAAKHVASDERLWTLPTFDVMTFRGSSYDAVALTMEQMVDEARGDLLIRRLYDWNVYGSAYAVSESVIAEKIRARVSPDMLTALMAMLAVRRWDLVMPTRQRAADALRLVDLPVSKRFLSVESLAGLRDLVSATEGSTDVFRTWKEVFLVDDAHIDDVHVILDDESLVGWTFSNRIKMAPLKASLIEELQEIAISSEPIQKRWRAIHTLGSFPSSRNAEILLQSLDERGSEFQLLRFGAIRALLETAALDDGGDVRGFVFASLITRIPTLVLDRRTAKELRNAVQIDPCAAPADWQSLTTELLTEFSYFEADDRIRGEWQELADTIEFRCT